MIAPFSFTGQASPDQTYQQGLQQYLAQGQSQIDPGKAQVAASSPISAAGIANLAKALQQGAQQPPLSAQVPTGIAQMAMAPNTMAATTPQMADQAQFMNPGQPIQGQAGPTPQALALAQQLQQDPNAMFMTGGY